MEQRGRGVDDAVGGTRPRVCFFGHHHTRLDSSIGGVLGFNKVPCPGSLLVIGLPPHSSSFSIIGKWPPHRRACLQAQRRSSEKVIPIGTIGVYASSDCVYCDFSMTDPKQTN